MREITGYFGRSRDADTVQHLDAPGLGFLLAHLPVLLNNLPDLIAHREHRIERTHRFLKNH
ncbi:hypothetical protein D3C85_1788570 [compost metagenome]